MKEFEHIAPERLASATPVEVDRVLAEIYYEAAQIEGYLDGARQRAAGYAQRGGRWHTEALAEVERYEQSLTELRAAATPYEDEFRRRPWYRYYLVNNSNGHVHREMSCSTCFPQTRYLWLIDLADCDEAEMIAEWGERACTVCFPDAPSNPDFLRPARRDREAQEQRAAEKAARDAAKAAKNLPESDQFPDLHGFGRVRTVAAAKAELREVAEARVSFEVAPTNEYRAELARKAVEVEAAARRALHAKGMTDEELDLIMSRAEKKARKHYGL